MAKTPPPRARRTSPGRPTSTGAHAPAAAPHGPDGADALDPITALALQRVRTAHPHARLLALTGWTMAELAKRVEPPVSRSRLADLFAQAEAYGRLTQEWADRLARAVGVEPQAIFDLFGIREPSRNGRPRVRRTA